MSRLPVELYRGIVGHVEEKHDLISLSTTSHNLGYEAERILYRELTFNLNVDKPSLNARIVDHVLSLRILSIRYDDSSILPILQSVKNLTSLHLGFFDVTISPFLYHCPSDAPFQLRHLSIEGHTGDPGFRAFVQSQRQITRFIWVPDALDTPSIDLSPTDFPTLTSLSSSFPHIVIALLPATPIRHLRYRGTFESSFATVTNQLRPGTVLTTVRALAVDTLTNMDLVAAIFPCLNYLEARSFSSPNFLSSIAQFTDLRKLKIRLSCRTTFEPVVPKIFDCIKSLDIVEIWSSKRIDGELVYSGVIFQRGISPPRVCYSEDDDEWWKW